MDNGDKDHPADPEGQGPPPGTAGEQGDSSTGPETGAAAQSEAGEKQPATAEQSLGTSPEPAAEAPATADSTEPSSPPEAQWPPEGIDQDEPGESAIAITEDDEQMPDGADVLLAAETGEADAGEADAGEAESEGAPSAGVEETEETPESGAEIDVQAVAAALDQRRERLLTELFGEERPRTASAEEVVQAYSAAVSDAAAADVLDAGEAAKMAQWVSERHQSALASEQSDLDKSAAEAKGHIEVYDNLYVKLEALVNDAAGELDRLDAEGEAFQNTPEPLQTVLLNFKKGIEIIHRMFARAMDRKKELAAELPAPSPDDWQPEEPPPEPENLGQYAMDLSQGYHKVRDANYHASRDAKKLAEKCRKTAVTAVSGLLSAVDGIDAGLENEPETRSKLAPFEGGEDCGPLIESWLQAYHRLDGALNQFLEATGIETHTVEPGTPFDPGTMEPQGTVANPEMNDEDVAGVLRRGFSLNGEPVRPILVDVVKNP